MDCKLFAIQMVSSDNIEDNFTQIEAQLKQIEQDTSTKHKLVLLPENALLFANRECYLKHAEQIGEGPIQTVLKTLAKRYACTLICGSMPTLTEQKDKIHTSCLVFSAQGELLGYYHKMHLFDADVSDSMGAYRESDTFVAGQQVKVIDCGFAKVGLAICYDLRFPGLFQALREQGAEIIVLPAAFTKVTGEAHWQPLLRARAIETQCYILAANQGGEHFQGREDITSRATYGHSMVIDGWGRVLDEMQLGVGLAQAEFVREQLFQVRKAMPIMQHKQFKSVPIVNNSDNSNS